MWERNRVDLVYKELSYRVVGVLFDVYNEIGLGHPEIVYQKAIQRIFENRGIVFQREKYCKVDCDGGRVSYYYPDFVVEGKLILELKVRQRFSRKCFEQIEKYLKTENLKLGILASFCSDGVIFKRVLNEY
ncbi:MAG: hypothetical protein UT32_C0015G0013 [Parcubacteria group bacterium GW2011_GWC2_39_14]|nr:MAG: hypothetical protein UT32_C0015G0013 [Parcubacteria group bacterium GW2011_GWC2_39_14]KKR54409.1 MAG: hypothetical protein UT91_C0016G0013 [Parcubacteria group bacterium GW2011_GWA2_40_23]